MLSCRNYIICQNISDKDFCFDCEMLFGKWRNKNINLKTGEGICTICNSNDVCITRPTCEHILCANCFKILYFGGNNYIKTKDNLDLTDYLEYQNSLKICKNCDLKT